MQNILFRADSSSSIGTGHIMRDLVLADQFKGDTIIFATRNLPGNINYKIEEKKYKIEIIHSNTIEEILKLIDQYSITMMVIDHYDIDICYEKELKERTGIKLFVLDDTYQRHYCDILLNHNIYGDQKRYKDLVPNNCELRCGAHYALLRDEFIQENQKPKKLSYGNYQKNVLIAMGGADHSNINIKILEVLCTFSDIHAQVVTTTANAHLQELKKYVDNNANITLHINTNHIATLMHQADFAIVTPSVTLNELFYMNIPFIAIKTANNQKEMYEYLLQNSYRVLENFDAINLKNALENVINTENITLHNFTDLSLTDKKMVLEWRNNPNIRKWMFTQDPITLNDHLTYIDSLKQKDDRLYFLVKKGTQPVGVIDFTNIDQKNKSTEFGIYANPALRQVGKLLMDTTIHYAFNKLKSDTLIAKVFKENIRAITLYIQYNFKEIPENGHIVHMELKQ